MSLSSPLFFLVFISYLKNLSRPFRSRATRSISFFFTPFTNTRERDRRRRVFRWGWCFWLCFSRPAPSWRKLVSFHRLSEGTPTVGGGGETVRLLLRQREIGRRKKRREKLTRESVRMKRERRGKGGWKINSRNKKDQTKIQTRETKTIETQAMLNRNDAGLRGGGGTSEGKKGRRQKERENTCSWEKE